jgi:hypothetical protein
MPGKLYLLSSGTFGPTNLEGMNFVPIGNEGWAALTELSGRNLEFCRQQFDGPVIATLSANSLLLRPLETPSSPSETSKGS